jgi:Lrp/AsnC family transcriptional regulator, leucine-responsive regulatory protein
MQNSKDEVVDKLLDEIGMQILHELQENARTSLSEIGRRVGLTPPAVAERVRRMEDAGIITGYHAQVNPTKLGLSITAYIRIAASENNSPALRKRIVDIPQIIECHLITGADDLLVKASCRSVDELEALISELMAYGQITTSLVLSSPVARRSLG